MGPWRLGRDRLELEGGSAGGVCLDFIGQEEFREERKDGLLRQVLALYQRQAGLKPHASQGTAPHCSHFPRPESAERKPKGRLRTLTT